MKTFLEKMKVLFILVVFCCLTVGRSAELPGVESAVCAFDGSGQVSTIQIVLSPNYTISKISSCIGDSQTSGDRYSFMITKPCNTPNEATFGVWIKPKEFTNFVGGRDYKIVTVKCDVALEVTALVSLGLITSVTPKAYPVSTGLVSESSTTPSYHWETTVEYSGGIRLVGGPSSYEGRVEVFYDGRWGTVCDDHWDAQAARVVCRMLGLYNGDHVIAMTGAYYGQGTFNQPILLDDVTCRGYENSIDHCSHSPWTTSDCSHSEDAGVACYGVGSSTSWTTASSRFWHILTTPDYGVQIRLAGGPSYNVGRVEVFHGGRWGTVCDDDWDFRDAQVVCRMLGLPHGDYVRAIGNAAYGQGSDLMPILLDDVTCSGTESSIAFCRRAGWGVHNCKHSEDASVACVDMEFSTTPYITSTTDVNCGGTLYAGRYWKSIETPNFPGFYPNNVYCEWTIIPEAWSTVKLTFLDFDIEQASCTKDYVEVNYQRYCGTITPYPVLSSNRLVLIFRSDSWGQYRGFRAEYVTVEETTTPPQEEATTIPYSSSTTEVYCGGTLYADRYWKTFETPNYPNYYPNNAYCYWTIIPVAGSTVKILFSEATTFDIEQGSCTKDYVEVNYQRYCGTVPPADVLSSSRIVVVFRSDSWGQYRGFQAFYKTVEETTTPFYWKTSPGYRRQIRLVDGPSPYEGRVEVYYGGQWGTVCDDGWDVQDAMVVCRMLGLWNGDRFVRAVGSAAYGNGLAYQPILLDDVDCFGYENSIDSCNHSAWNTSNCSHNEDAGVNCYSEYATTSHFQHTTPSTKRVNTKIPYNWTTYVPNTGYCGGTLNAERILKSVQTPNYPGYYPNDMYCKWTILPEPGTTVKLSFVQFSVDQLQSSCDMDYVEVNNQKYCGNEAPPPVLSSSSIILVFRSDYWGQHAGFLAHYVTDGIEGINLICNQSAFEVSVNMSALPNSNGMAVVPSHVILGSPKCSGFISGDMIFFSVRYNECLTKHTLVGDFVEFSTNIFYREDGFQDEIGSMRWNVDLACRFPLSEADSASFPGVHYNTTLKEFGSGTVAKVELFTDSTFREPVTSSLTPGQPVYVRVTAENLPTESVLVVRNCTASPSLPSDEVSPSALIRDGCIVHAHTRILANRDHETYFTFAAFGFIGGGAEKVSCDVHICGKSDFSDSCSQTCLTTNPAPPPPPGAEPAAFPKAKVRLLFQRVAEHS